MALLQLEDFDNAKTDLDFIDSIETATTDSEVSRLGEDFDTRIGRLKKNGFVELVPGAAWAPGLDFTDYTQFLIFSNQVYVLAETVVPPVTTGASPDANFKQLVSYVDDDITDKGDEYNTTDLKKFTDIVFASQQDMEDLLLPNGDPINVVEGDFLKVSDEADVYTTYKVINFGQIQPGDITILLTNGLYALEFVYALDPSAGNPLRKLNFDNDAMTELEGNVIIGNYSSQLSGLSQLTGATLAQNGKVYFGPGTTSTVLAFSTTSLTFEEYPITPLPSGNFNSGVLAPNGKIYYPPSSGQNVLVFDTATGTESSINVGIVGNYTNGGCLADNGKIYCIGTQNNQQILEIDPSDDSFVLIPKPNPVGDPYGSKTWKGHTIAGNGKIYAAPQFSTSFIEFDPDTGVTNYFGSAPSGSIQGLFSDMVLGKDGFLYAIPANDDVDSIYRIDPDTLTIDTNYVDFNLTSSQQHRSACSASNGRIYILFDDGSGTDAVAEVDIDDATFNRIEYSGASGTFIGLCQGDNGIMVSKSTNGYAIIVKNAFGDEAWTKSAYVAKNS